jgi:hypothetical protein
MLLTRRLETAARVSLVGRSPLARKSCGAVRAIPTASPEALPGLSVSGRIEGCGRVAVRALARHAERLLHMMDATTGPLVVRGVEVRVARICAADLAAV